MNPSGRATSASIALQRGPADMLNPIIRIVFYAVLAVLVAFLLGGIVLGTGAGIIGGMARQFLPVFVALVVMFTLSIVYKQLEPVWFPLPRPPCRTGSRPPDRPGGAMRCH